jgi:uncharacterized membrane protein YjfL (UPF0719 family)
MTSETLGTAGTAIAALVAFVLQHFRINALPEKIKEEVRADALKAAALILADAVLAAAKIKADARLAAGSD